MLLEFDRPIEDLARCFRFFLLRRAFFAYFWLTKCMMVFLELSFDFPIRWQASISLLEALTSILSRISINFHSRSTSSISFEIPVISKLFLRPYCSKRFPFSSREITFFFKLSTLKLKRWFSICKFFMTTSYKFRSSLSTPSKRINIVFSRFMINSEKLEFSGVLKFSGVLGTFPFTETEFCPVL